MSNDHIKTLARQIQPVSALSETLQAIFWTAFYDFYRSSEDDEYTVIMFQLFAENLLKHNFLSPLQSTVESLFPEVTYAFKEHCPDVLNLPLPVSVHETKRFEHTWICAKHGSGKTTLLENMIFHDLEKVKVGKATVLVMDSQGKNELLGRVNDSFPCMTIDTTTPLNIFAAPRRPSNPREAEILYTNQIDLITYVFSTTLGEGGNFTTKQRTLFTYLVQFVMAAEGTVADMLRLLLPKGIAAYPNVISRLSPPAQLFFATQFDDPKQYVDTKKEIHWRLDSILNRPSFARMFTQKRNLDLYSALQKPQCILVDTDKALLGQQGTEIFGRFIIAMLLSASQQRANVKSDHRLPVYAYIDECHDIIANDENIAFLIDQARKMKIAFTFAHQRESQIQSSQVLDALKHTAIQMTLAQKYHFNYLVDGTMPITVTSPPVKRAIKSTPSTPGNLPGVFVYEGEIIEPEKPKKPLGLGYDDDDTSAR